MLRGIRLQEGKMDIQSIYGIENEAERVNTLYAQVFREETRLTWSQAARVEFLTTVRYLEKYLRPGAKLLDVGAGAGEYSLHFARQGYSVDAVELDNSKLGRLMARHLLELGHRKVGYIAPPLTVRQKQRSKRVEGFLKEFQKAGLVLGGSGNRISRLLIHRNTFTG